MNARRYLNLEGFDALARSTTPIETNRLVVVSSVPTSVRAIGKDNARRVEFLISTNRVDREQDTIAADGWDFSDFTRNPVVLWCHDHNAPPVARSVELSRVPNGIRSVAEFTPEDVYPFGYMIGRLYEGGFMHAVSVGFEPRQFTPAPDRPYGVNYLKQSLLEYSCVPVPANPDALALARSKGINLAPMKSWAERLLDERPSTWGGDTRHQLEVLRSIVFDGRPSVFDIRRTADDDTIDTIEASEEQIAQAIREAVDEALNPTETIEMDDEELDRTIRDGVGRAIDSAIAAHLGRIDDGDDPTPATLGGLHADDTIEASEDDITRAVADVITDEINKHLGRVD
jgi:phage head maturation protease